MKQKFSYQSIASSLSDNENKMITCWYLPPLFKIDTDKQLMASFGIERNRTSYILESSLIDHTMYDHEPNNLLVILENS
jgi:hypothetical protein